MLVLMSLRRIVSEVEDDMMGFREEIDHMIEMKLVMSSNIRLIKISAAVALLRRKAGCCAERIRRRRDATLAN